jgi:hypothetical protein
MRFSLFITNRKSRKCRDILPLIQQVSCACQTNLSYYMSDSRKDSHLPLRTACFYTRGAAITRYKIIPENFYIEEVLVYP